MTKAAHFPSAIEDWLARERDSLVLWLPVAFGVGVAAWFLIPATPGWISLMLVATGVAIMAVAIGGKSRAGMGLALFFLLVALGCAWTWGRAEHMAGQPIARPMVARFEAGVERVEHLVARDLVRLTLAPRAGQGLPPRVRVNVETGKAPGEIESGDVVRVRARLMPPPGAALPGGYDFGRVAWFRELGATGRALDPVVVVRGVRAERGFSAWLARLRARLTAHVRAAVPGSGGGIAAALVTGEQGGIGEADAEAMRTSGLAHLLSISGLHVAVVVGGVMLATLRLLALRPRLALHLPLPAIAAGAAAVAGVAYTLLAGAEVPTLRACIAALLVLAALLIGREAMTLRLVAAAALLLLLARPEALVGPSFQLSFAAVVAIVTLHAHPRVAGWLKRREEGWAARAGRALAGLLLTGVAVELALLPIALFHFHRAGLYGSLANMVAIPLTSFVIMPAEGLALLFDLLGWGAPFWWVAGQALGLLLALAHRVSAIPGAVAALPGMPVAAFGLMVAGGLWFCLWSLRPRWLGLAPLTCGAAWALATPPPDMLVTADGRHVAIRTARGMALLRPRAGDYVRKGMAEAGGIGEMLEIEALPGARCSPDLCRITLGQGPYLRVLATRSSYPVRWAELIRACATSDIVVSDRRLPARCRPAWIRADRDFLARHGGMAIGLSPLSLRFSRLPGDAHPWVVQPTGWPPLMVRSTRP